jgi:hypothetical protein
MHSCVDGVLSQEHGYRQAVAIKQLDVAIEFGGSEIRPKLKTRV